MTFNPFRKVNIRALNDVDRIQDNIANAMNKINRVVLIDGVLVEGVTLGTVATKVDHKLTRQPLGWFVVDIDKAADIHRTSWDSRTIELVSSAADTTVNLWVF